MFAKRNVMETAALGAIGGVIGASCMSALRMAAHRAGLLDKQVPQAVEEWVSHGTGIHPGFAGHQALTQLIHLGYGMGWGALYGVLAGSRRGATVAKGSTFGTAQWAVGFLGLLPALGIARPAWKQSTTENSLNIAAHLLYGVVTALMTEELARQPEQSRLPGFVRRAPAIA